MKTLEIEYNTDYHDCDTCGSSFANGAIVKLDGETILDASAIASCFGSVNVQYEHILIALCRKLNIEIKEINQEVDIEHYADELEDYWGFNK